MTMALRAIAKKKSKLTKEEPKGKSATYKTFKKWNYASNVIGHPCEEDEASSTSHVTFVWCKLCAKYSVQAKANLQGTAADSIESFGQGTNFVTKYTTD
jgi:hypothetical protein